ncbi:hypothetical protein M2302_004997, partial [Micromonospora sp. A200]|nr:hypothetical protein [Micromonospora sp. A200]
MEEINSAANADRWRRVERHGCLRPSDTPMVFHPSTDPDMPLA